MSDDSESENENFCFFGKPLEPYDENAFPKKKPISVEDQIATDAQGRRRFHGAFTGGFSAGFYNTVGSLEGWAPREYKSSRQEKNESRLQKPEDFMDEEDFGEYGIAAQTVKATKDYSTANKKRKRHQVFTDGPIPGEPVLHTLLSSGNETVGYLLLKNIGLQSAGEATQERTYGCQMPTTSYEISRDVSNNSYKVPAIYKEFLTTPKHNSFGLGYEGLQRSQNINLFDNSSANFVVRDTNNKKISIRGQAFGVGAFEEDDADIYSKDDMNQYDYELTSERQVKTKPKSHTPISSTIFGKFVVSKLVLVNKKRYKPPTIPHSFTGKYKQKKSRFEEITPEEPTTKINPLIRAKYLGEDTPVPIKTDVEPPQNIETSPRKIDDVEPPKTFESSFLTDRFVSSTKKEDVTNILEPVHRMETEHGTEQMRAAVRMKMFGPLTRVSSSWQPCALLCKRFNVPEPFADRPDQENKKRTKNLIFEYQKHFEEQEPLKPGLSIKTEAITNEPTSTINTDTNITQNNDIDIEPKDETIEHSTALEEEPPVVNDITTDKINVAENMDLFKAVFMDSSDSESDSEDNNANVATKVTDNQEMISNVLSEQFIPKIKPLKEGILSNVDFNEPKRSFELVQPAPTTVIDSNSDVYGPKVLVAASSGTQTKLLVISSDASDDEWVEKDDVREKKIKKKKSKHKKDKKRKKHKRKN